MKSIQTAAAIFTISPPARNMNLIWNLNFVVWAAAAFAFGSQSRTYSKGEDSLEVKVCEDFPCYNGGTCALLGLSVLCFCPPGYTGLHCQFLEKEATPKGQAPFCGGNRLMGSCDHLACIVDQDCPDNKSCCFTMCGATECYDPSCDKCEWSEWSKCEPRQGYHCGGYGHQIRTRKEDCCQIPEERSHRQGCDLEPCPPCKMGLWGSWSPCDVSCGTGNQRRSRSPHSWNNCDMPSQQEFRDCSLPDCPCVDESRQCANFLECRRTNAYEGMRNKTQSGVPCQYWDTQSAFSEVGHHNYCRNLDDFGGPWCFTSGDLPFDFCFPECEQYWTY